MVSVRVAAQQRLLLLAITDPKKMCFQSGKVRFTVAEMAATPPVVLTIAGFDPSSGAGITADIKTIAAHDCYGVSCITTLTVQSTSGVRRVQPVSSDIILETLQELIADIGVNAVHVGMLGTAVATRPIENPAGKG